MIRAENLSKYFGGKRALGPVSFEIEDGETVGFLGLNGAGKTTALRILACDLRPSGGTVAVGNIDALANAHEVRKRIGFLPESPPLYPDMTVRDFLRFAGRLREMASSEIERRLPEVSEMTHLEDVGNELIRALSHGYRQRVGVAQAIIHRPKFLILDEPTRGLDPVQIVEMRNMIRTLKDDHTVLISSHILTEISETCDRLLVLGRGEIIGSGSEEGLSSDLLGAKRIVVGVRAGGKDDTAAVKTCIGKVEGVTSVGDPVREEEAHMFEIESSQDVRADVCRALVEAGHDIIKLDRARRELESIFLRLVQGGADAPN